MAKQDSDQADTINPAKNTLGLLERAWNFQWALRLLCFVLFLDVAMMLHIGHGLWQWSAADMALFRNVGWLAVLIVMFSLAVSIVIPAVLDFLRQISIPILYGLSSRLSFTQSDSRRYQRDIGKVPARELLDLALQEKDEFLFRLYEEHIRSKEEDEAFRRQVGDLTAAASLVSLIDWIVSLRVSGSIGLINASYAALGTLAPIVTGILLLCVGAIVKLAWFAPWRPEEIYYPPLDAVLRAKERERQTG